MDRLSYPLENTHFLILSFFSRISLLMKNQFHLWFIIWILVISWTGPSVFFIRYILLRQSVAFPQQPDPGSLQEQNLPRSSHPEAPGRLRAERGVV